MAIINCPECGKQVSDKAEECPHCGCPIESMFSCPECGEQLFERIEECPRCGYPLMDMDDDDDGEDADDNSYIAGKKIAILLKKLLNWLKFWQWVQKAPPFPNGL